MDSAEAADYMITAREGPLPRRPSRIEEGARLPEKEST
jgi:hypothetical protein